MNKTAWIACLRNDIKILDHNEPIGQYDVECRRFDRMAKLLKVIKSKAWRSQNPWFFAALPITIKEVEQFKVKCFQRAAAARMSLRQFNLPQHEKWKRLQALKKVIDMNKNPNTEQNTHFDNERTK